jgi:hypothetical protein
MKFVVNPTEFTFLSASSFAYFDVQGLFTNLLERQEKGSFDFALKSFRLLNKLAVMNIEIMLKLFSIYIMKQVCVAENYKMAVKWGRGTSDTLSSECYDLHWWEIS